MDERLALRDGILYTVFGNKSFKIGELRGEGGEEYLVIYRDYNRHLHRNTNSFGISEQAIHSGLFEYVVINTNREDLFIVPTTYFIENGTRSKFSGYEVQLFLTIRQLSQFIPRRLK